MPAVLLGLIVLLGACGASAPALTDPDEIISQGMQATSQATSFHMDATVSGTINIPETGGTFNLQGTNAAFDFDVANETGRLSFEAPGLMSLSGEAILIGGDAFVKTSLTGEKYMKSDAGSSGVPVDPDEVLSQVSGFLDEEGVETAKQDDVSCGDNTCYAVTLTIPSSLLGSAGAAGVDAGDFLGEDLVLNLQFDRESLRLVQASTDVDAGEAGSFGLLITFSRYNESVQVSPPPDDLVTEGGSGLPF
jgi:hypothetical protein